MLKENEIRIGNTFYFPFHNQNVSILGYAKIEKDNSFKVQFETNGGILLEPLSVLRPILLTEEILLKCKEFKKSDDTGGVFIYLNNQDIDKITFRDIEGFACFNGIKYRTLLKHITRLHQIQNLLFSLTNTELNITI